MTLVAAPEAEAAIRRFDVLRAVEILFAGFAILFMTGGLTRLLTGGLPEDVARETSSPLVQLSGLLIYALTLAFLGLRLQRYLPLILRNAVLFVPVLFALASTYWSSDPDLTVRRAISLFGTTALGLYLALRFDLRELANLLFVTLSLIVGLSFAAAILAPGFGVHQAGDALTAHHAGLWRGLYWHKNALGPVASILTLIVIALWRQIGFPPFVKLGMIGVSAIVVLKTGSSQALFQFCVFTVLLLAHFQFSRIKRDTRVAIFFVLAAAVFPLLLFFSELQAIALELLGRDATLSSRIYIWRAAILGGLKHPIFGNGYDVGWHGGADVIALQLYYTDVGHAHNGYLQHWLDLGFVGLALLGWVWVILLVRVFAVARHSYDVYVVSLYFLLYYFISNYITTFLMKYQDVYWMLLSILFVLCSRTLWEARQRARAGPAERAPP